MECENSVSCQHSWYSCKGWLKYAIQSAIIAVEEIIKVAWWQSTSEMKEPYRHSQKEYWNEVLNYLKSKQ